MAAGAGVAAALVVVFVLCAIVQAIAPGLQFSHAWIGLFTLAPLGSPQAWIEGIVYSVVTGFITGWIFARVYSAVAK